MKKILTLFFSIALSTLVHAQSTTPIANNTPGFIKKATDLGAVDPSTVITVTVWLKLHNDGQLDGLVQGQYKKGSSSYHKWITQDQFNASFGPTSQEVNSVQNFLRAHGLTILAIAENNMYIKVQDTVGAIEKAFHVQIDSYKFRGNTYRSNKADPSVDNRAGGHIATITGMDNSGFRPATARASGPDGKPFLARPLGKIKPGGLFFEGRAFPSSAERCGVAIAP